MFRRGGSQEWFDERDMRSLDRDLRQIVIEERCSYGPELRAQLIEEHARLEGGRRSRSWSASAVGIAAMLMLVLAGSLAFPGTRDAVLGVFQSPVVVETARSVIVRPRGGGLVESAPSVTAPISEPPNPATGSVSGEPTENPLPSPLLPGTVPELLDRNEARMIVAQEYPALLQQKGIGGRVRILMWVGPEGTTEFPQIEHTSGLRELDLAALRAMQALRFVPATRLGEAVGTWVSFSIRFQPGGTDLVQPDPEYATFHIPLSN